MATVKKEKNGFGWAFPAKLLVGALLCLALTACGGGSGGSNNNNGNGNGSELPNPATYNLSCQRVSDGQQDGVCFKVEGGEEIGLFNRTHAVKEVDESRATVWFESWDSITDLGAVYIGVPTDGQTSSSCESNYNVRVVLPAAIDPSNPGGFLKGACLTALEKTGERYSGDFSGTFVKNNKTHTISNGYFSFTLWGDGDYIRGNINGNHHNQEDDFQVWQYLPKEKLLLGKSAVAAENLGDRWIVFIRDLDLLEQGPVSDLACNPNGSYVSYFRETAGGSEQNRYEMTSCQMSFEEEAGRLTGSFSGKMYDVNQEQDVDYSGEFNVTLPTTPVRYGYPIP